ncbi:MAG: DUF45 domain-containing protein [Clostridia bacterium]|nr:DUF45 domain-containing protein [Clostridia bacterium]
MSIIKFEKKPISNTYLTIALLGTSYKLNIKYTASNSINLVKKDGSFELILPKKYKNTDNIDIVNQAIQKLYTEIAPKELENSLELVRHIVKFAPEDYKIQRMENSFYKILKNKVLVINPDIIQYNREIINTTLIQAFCKTYFKTNTKIYKETLKSALQSYENYKIARNDNNNRIYMIG